MRLAELCGGGTHWDGQLPARTGGGQVVASSQTHGGHTDLDSAGRYASRGHPAGQHKCVPVEMAAGEQPLTGCSYGGRLGQS